MFCNKCGTYLSDDSQYCYACGYVIPEAILNENSLAEAPADATPYQDNSVPAPYGVPYGQPESQAPQNVEPVSQPYDQPYNQPYNQPMQNYQQASYGSPYGVPQQTPPYQSYTAEPAQSSSFNVFPYISAGMMALISLMFFMPWFTSYGEGYNLFSPLLDNFSYELGGLFLCTILMIIDFGMLIPGFVLALTKRQNMPISFVVASSVFTFIIITIAAIIANDAYSVEATIVPYLTFFLTIGNIVFGILARKQ